MSDMDKLKIALDALPARPWSVSTSCSFRRITGTDGRDGGVLCAVTQRSDGHPDLSMDEETLQALCDVVNLADTLPRKRTVAVDGMPEAEFRVLLFDHDGGAVIALATPQGRWESDDRPCTYAPHPVDRWIYLSELMQLPGGSGG